MRAILALVVLGGIASAEPYPLAEVDRPLVLLPGMTTLDMSEDFSTAVNATVDATGQSTITTTTLGRALFDLTVSHAFGPVEVTARLVGVDAIVRAKIETGIPGALTLDLDYASINSPNYFDSQSLSYAYKRIITPHRFAFNANAGVALREQGFISNQQLKVVGHVVDAFAGGGPEFQLTPRIALGAGALIAVPVEHSTSIDVQTLVGADALVTVAFHRCDLYGLFELDGLTHDIFPYVALGIVVRWGTLAS